MVIVDEYALINVVSMQRFIASLFTQTSEYELLKNHPIIVTSFLYFLTESLRGNGS